MKPLSELIVDDDRDFDAAFLDVQLPGMDGVESLLEIGKLKPDAKVFMMTGYAVEEAESINALRAMNVTGCLVKPFDPAALAQELEGMSEGRG